MSSSQRRRIGRFSLRTLLGLMLVFGCGLGWLAAELRPKFRERSVARWILQQGGAVHYDNFAARDSPSWMKRWFGDDFGLRVQYAVFPAIATDADMTQLDALPGVETLDLMGTKITDASIEPTSRLPRLRLLYLRNTRVSPAAVARLRASRPTLTVYADEDSAAMFGQKLIRTEKTDSR